MKTLSLKLDQDIFLETEKVIMVIDKPRNRYINEALDYYNKLQKRRILSAKLTSESKLVNKESLKVLREFEKLNDDY